MKKVRSYILLLFLTFGVNAFCSQQSPFEKKQSLPETVTISSEMLMDKIKGGWAGQTIGCTYGGPTEFKYNGTMIQDYIPIDWSDGCIKWWYENVPGLYDDVYMDLTFVDVFDRLGLDAPIDSFALAFAKAQYPLWHANQAARYNILQGIRPPESGHWLNNPHADDIDYQIEADFAGLMSPGMPNSASAISDKVGHIFTYGDGWYGGVYVGALYSMAFVTDDVLVTVEEALNTIPEQSDFYKCIKDVIDWYHKYPDDWKQTWFECQRKWSSEVGCPDGVFLPFDIDAKLNSAYVTIGLLYGKKDFYQTIDIAARCGQDSDCNAATAAGVLGVLLGYENIPEMWKESLYAVEELPFAYTDVSLNRLYKLSLGHAIKAIEAGGGVVNGDQITIKIQQPVAVNYEKAFEGHYPVEKKNINILLQQASQFSFDGNGFVLKGYVKCDDEDYVANVEMYIDGELVETANLPVAKASSIDDRRVDLFHKYQLEDMEHTVVLEWKNPNKNAQIYLGEVLVYASQSR